MPIKNAFKPSSFMFLICIFVLWLSVLYSLAIISLAVFGPIFVCMPITYLTYRICCDRPTRGNYGLPISVKARR